MSICEHRSQTFPPFFGRNLSAASIRHWTGLLPASIQAELVFPCPSTKFRELRPRGVLFHPFDCKRSIYFSLIGGPLDESTNLPLSPPSWQFFDAVIMPVMRAGFPDLSFFWVDFSIMPPQHRISTPSPDPFVNLFCVVLFARGLRWHTSPRLQ